MHLPEKIANRLEKHWVTPAYSGWLLGSLSLFFFFAATNTMAGWLYVLSGVGLAVLAIAAILPERNLRQIQIHRGIIHPVSAGDELTIELTLYNPTNQSKVLMQVQDMLPFVLAEPTRSVVETIPAQGSHSWVYFQPTQRRGIYRWDTVQLRTGAPLGLFWCQRSRIVPAIATVYPAILPLTHCPLIDEVGRDPNLDFSSDRRTQTATEGITRSLRPYRWGDPTRLIHWRTSARYAELQIRELEVFTGNQELLICLDSASPWQQPQAAYSESFEQAVTVAASLYFYALRRHLSAKLWTATTGTVHGNTVVLETLAAIQAGDTNASAVLPTQPFIWLTQNPSSITTLPMGSRWLLWSSVASWTEAITDMKSRNPGLTIQPDQDLQLQLQKAVG